MKTCAYCGREEAEEAVRCSGCGTEFTNELATEERPNNDPAASARAGHDWDWLKSASVYLGAAVGLMLLYLLSLGPVLRYCAQVTSTSTTTPTGMRTAVTMKLPKWTGVVYEPAWFVVRSTPFGEAYHNYLEWWQPALRPN